MNDDPSFEMAIGEEAIARIAAVLRAIFYGHETDGLAPIGAEHPDRDRFLAMARATRRIEWSVAGHARVLICAGR